MGSMNRDVIEQWVRRNIRSSFSKSGGPGGQNVNKLSTKVTAWVPILSMDILQYEERKILEKNLSRRVNKNHELIVRVQDTRSQVQNRDLAVRRITVIIEKALRKRKKRLRTSPPPHEKEERIREKKLVGKKKRLRGRINHNDDGGLG